MVEELTEIFPSASGPFIRHRLGFLQIERFFKKIFKPELIQDSNDIKEILNKTLYSKILH